MRRRWWLSAGLVVFAVGGWTTFVVTSPPAWIQDVERAQSLEEVEQKMKGAFPWTQIVTGASSYRQYRKGGYFIEVVASSELRGDVFSVKVSPDPANSFFEQLRYRIGF
jgi:hypothetical protein